MSFGLYIVGRWAPTWRMCLRNGSGSASFAWSAWRSSMAWRRPGRRTRRR